MKRRGLFSLQLLVTALTALFMIVPVVMSMLAGVTQNYFIGVRSGLTLQWVAQVWQMYAGTFWLSLLIALCCLLITLVTGVPAAWGLLKAPGRWAAAAGAAGAAAGALAPELLACSTRFTLSMICCVSKGLSAYSSAPAAEPLAAS